MVGNTLADIRERLDDLAVAVGPYRIVSSRTGSAPFPVAGLQFPDRGTAAEAASVATAYRAALRRYDPNVTVHDLIVCEAPCGTEPDARDQTLPEYCHTIAGSLFEVLSSRHRAVERTVMDDYLAAAEETENRERLCLSMLESMASALDGRLDTDEQADLLLAAAAQLPDRTPGTDPLTGALAALEAAGLIDDATVEPAADDPGCHSRYVTLRNYRPSLSATRCPVVPLVVELLRRTSIAPHVVGAERTDDGWRLLVSTTGDRPAAGLAVVTPGV